MFVSSLCVRLPQHQADLVRLALLDNFGGVWCDVGILLFESLDPLWNRLVATSGTASNTPGAVASEDVRSAFGLPENRDHGNSESERQFTATGGLAHFYLREWGSLAYDRKDFVEVDLRQMLKPSRVVS